MLLPGTADDPQYQARVGAFLQGMQEAEAVIGLAALTLRQTMRGRRKRMPGLRRREVVRLLGGAAFACPFPARPVGRAGDWVSQRLIARY